MTVLSLSTTSQVTYYRWKLSDAIFHHCDACRRYDGQVKTGEEWDTTATPPLHPGCGCSLVFDHADEIVTPGTAGETTNNPSGPPGLSGEKPFAIPKPDDNTPKYPPATPPAVITKGPPQRRR